MMLTASECAVRSGRLIVRMCAEAWLQQSMEQGCYYDQLYQSC